MVLAIIRELKIRSEEAENLLIESVYFGGGTPSVLSPKELTSIFKSIQLNYKLDPKAEISFEVNPDDLSEEYLGNLNSNTLINRLSIGIQSFHDDHLKMMNRRHTAKEAYESIERAGKYGFENMNIDLIYGIPGMTEKEWIENLNIFLEFKIPHLSAYHLTFEPKTVFSHYQKKGKLFPVNEDTSLEQYEILLDYTEKHGYENYEISNFAKQDFYSRHNLSYWTGKQYLGIGPSAHSYNGLQRRWNIANNTAYIDALENNSSEYFDTEEINEKMAYNEYLLTALRTIWGIDTDYIAQKFGDEIVRKCTQNLKSFLKDETILKNGNTYFLSRKGKVIADYVISEMMIL